MSKYTEDMIAAGRGHLLRPEDYDDAPTGVNHEGAEDECETCHGERVIITKGDGSEVEDCPACVNTVLEDW